jgi:hypothetical protein
MTYQNIIDGRKEFVAYSLQPFISAIENRLSMDDITAHGNEVRFVSHRKIDQYCQGGYSEEATADNIMKAIADCKAVLVSKIGNCPKEKLEAAGIKTVEAYDVIEKVALEFYEQYVKANG